MIIEVTSLAGYLLQGTGVGILLTSLYIRNSYKNKMPMACIYSIVGSIILLIYSLLTAQYLMIFLNLITTIMSYKGYRLWSKK